MATKSRFSDLCDEPVDHLLSPIKGYQDEPLLPLSETIKPISSFFNEIEDNVFVALHNCQNPIDELNQKESASIHLYTMEFDGGPSLYLLLNQSLRAQNRQELKPWFLFLKLFLTALHKLPSQSRTIWRGVKNVDLTSKYKTGTKFAWWGVSSCTTHLEVLESNEFLGKTGERTLFSIECFNGKSIVNHSYFKSNEKEIILMPGSYFEVISQANPAPELHIIHLKEISPPIQLVKSPFPKPINSSTINQTTTASQSSPNIIKPMLTKAKTIWKPFGITIAGGNGEGHKLNQLNRPHGIFIDDDQTIYIADCWNDRVVEWKLNATNGQIVAGGNGRGNKMNQLNYPRDIIIDQETNSLIIADRGNRRVMRWSRQNKTNGEVIISNIDCARLTMDKYGSLYVSDCKKNEVRRWKRNEKNGTLITIGNRKDDQLNFPTDIFIDEDDSLFVLDHDNHRVMKWIKDAKEGIVVAGGNGRGNSLTQLSYPRGVIVDQLGQIYVADWENHRVMRWCNGAKEGTIVAGGNGRGEESNQFDGPNGLSFDREGNLYVADWGNNRIQKFEVE